MQKLKIAFLVFTGLLLMNPLQAQSLKGSKASMARQNQEANRYGYSFIKTSQSVTKFVNDGQLVRVSADRALDLHDVSFPFARPAVKLFLDRLSVQYFGACGEKLTVTSLVRPINLQPPNAAANSVHPTGMAVDLRVPSKRSCRSWLEKTLLSLEATDVLDVTRERNPPHYHVAVFTQTYEQYVAGLARPNSDTPQEYEVRPRDSLWEISSRTGVSVSQLRSANNLAGNLIRPGQKLIIPNIDSTLVANIDNTEVASVTKSTYKVKKGDSLWRIGNRYGTSANQIRAENGLADDSLQIGQVLQITVGR